MTQFSYEEINWSKSDAVQLIIVIVYLCLLR